MGIAKALDPLYRIIPQVRTPPQKPNLRGKLIWTAAVLVIYYLMTLVPVIGVTATSSEQLSIYQTLLASSIGSLMTLGIGPIVMASIVLQLLVGGKFINLDLSKPEDKITFTNLQKVLTLVFAVFEAGAYTGFGGMFQSLMMPAPGMGVLVMLQIIVGAIIAMYLDEIVSKYGIGSGVGLFIAAGVSVQFFWQVLSPPDMGARAILFQIINSVGTGSIPIAIALIIPILFAVLIFAAVTFAEGMHVNIPIAMGPKGMGGRFPIKLLYVSNMPVILAAALFANIQIIGSAFANSTGILAGIVQGLVWTTQVPNVDGYGIVEALFILGPSGTLGLELLHALVYLAILTVLCIIFGKFWVELGGQGTEAIANQLDKSGMYIPGFRKDPRVIRSILERYIPPITILGSILVGVLAGLSDIVMGSLVSGTGILLTVGIVYRMYEELAKEELSAANPLLRRFLG